MRIYCLLSLFISLGLWSGCKSDAATKSATDSTETEASNPASTVEEVPETRGNSKPGQGSEYTFLTHQMFHIQAAVVSGKDIKEQPYKGHWIDLLPNGNFHYGKLKKEMYSGTWTYNDEAEVLALYPNDEAEKRSEWKVMHNEQMVILIGTQTYGNNGTQMQLIRHAEMPE